MVKPAMLQLYSSDQNAMLLGGDVVTYLDRVTGPHGGVGVQMDERVGWQFGIKVAFRP